MWRSEKEQHRRKQWKDFDGRCRCKDFPFIFWQNTESLTLAMLLGRQHALYLISLPRLLLWVVIFYSYIHENLIQLDLLHTVLVYLVQIMLKSVSKECVIELTCSLILFILFPPLYFSYPFFSFQCLTIYFALCRLYVENSILVLLNNKIKQSTFYRSYWLHSTIPESDSNIPRSQQKRAPEELYKMKGF